MTFALWEPPLLPDRGASGADSAASELADLIRSAGRRCGRPPTCSPTRSPPGYAPSPSSGPARGAEVVAADARRALDEAVPGLGDRVAAYRAGYLREERRDAGTGPARTATCSAWPPPTRSSWAST